MTPAAPCYMVSLPQAACKMLSGEDREHQCLCPIQLRTLAQALCLPTLVQDPLFFFFFLAPGSVFLETLEVKK